MGLTVNLIQNLDLLIFDIDGVLVDVRTSYRQAIKLTAEHFSKQDVSHSDIQALKNESGYNNDWDLTQELLKRLGFTPDREEIVDYFQNIYWGNNGDGLIKDEAWLLDKTVFDSIKAKFKLAVFTGRPREEAEFVLKNNGIYDSIEMLVAMEDVQNGKPDPEGMNAILKELNINPDTACYFGDTYDDMRCAVRANVTAIAVLAPGADRSSMEKNFKEAGAVELLSSINDMLKI